MDVPGLPIEAKLVDKILKQAGERAVQREDADAFAGIFSRQMSGAMHQDASFATARNPGQNHGLVKCGFGDPPLVGMQEKHPFLEPGGIKEPFQFLGGARSFRMVT